MLGFHSRDAFKNVNSSSEWDHASDPDNGHDSKGLKGGQYSWENMLTLAVLFGLSSVYIYLLLSPDQPAPLGKPRPCVIPADTKQRFEEFLKSYHTEYSYEGYDLDKLQSSFDGALTSESIEKEWGAKGSKDDFFYEGRDAGGETIEKYEPYLLYQAVFLRKHQ